MVIFRGIYCHKWDRVSDCVLYFVVSADGIFEPVSLGQHGVNKACLTYFIQLRGFQSFTQKKLNKYINNLNCLARIQHKEKHANPVCA